MWLLLPLAALSAEDVRIGTPSIDAIEEALVDELNANLGLSLPQAPDTYHLRYHLLDLDAVSVEASFGSLVQSADEPFATLGVEMRVGTPEYDNTGFGGWQNGFNRATLPQLLTDYAVRLAAWRVTDQAYKQAVEQYARKAAQFTAPASYPGDYTLLGATMSRSPLPAVGERPQLESLARAVSAGFVGDVALERGEVRIGHESGYHLIVDTEGTRVLRPMEETTVRAYAQLRAYDGMLLTDQVLWTVRPVSDLPAPEAMVAHSTAIRKHLAEVAAATPFEGEYVGPVVLEDQAATDLFRYLLTPQIEGTPDEVPFDSWFGELGDRSDPVRIGRRVLPPGWTAVDDPLADPVFPGSFRHDFEGSPATSVRVIESGIVKRVLMSRVPRKGTSGTTGHARSYPGSRAKARVSSLTVTAPKKGLSSSKLYQRALRVASEYDRDWFYIVRRLQEPAVRNVGQGFSFLGDDDSSSSLPQPVALYRRYADGTEVMERGARFAGIQRFVLRDIAASGAQVQASYLAPVEGDYGSIGVTEGLPTRISAPEVLIGEVELVAAPGDPQDVPLLPLPTR